MQQKVNSSYTHVIDGAINWLLTSGIQVFSDDRQVSGGFAAWYDEKSGTMPYVYSEISGYLITLMTWLYDRTGDSRCLNSAQRAAHWLISSQICDSSHGAYKCLFPLEDSRFDYKCNRIYAFDCGIILNGLVNLFRVTRDPKYLDEALCVGDWLVNASQMPDGGFRPVYDLTTSEWINMDHEWSLCPGGYHTKIGIGLTNLYSVTGEARYRIAAERSCDFALNFQQPDGRFITLPANGGTNSHAHAYTAEGLWVVGKLLGREDYLLSSEMATRWLFRWQSPDGRVPRHYYNGEAIYHERVDVSSQALRLAELQIADRRLDDLSLVALDKLIAVILQSRVRSQDHRANGAFYFGYSSKGEAIHHANTWVSAFAIQALSLHADRVRGLFDFEPFFFV